MHMSRTHDWTLHWGVSVFDVSKSSCLLGPPASVENKRANRSRHAPSLCDAKQWSVYSGKFDDFNRVKHRVPGTMHMSRAQCRLVILHGLRALASNPDMDLFDPQVPDLLHLVLPAAQMETIIACLRELKKRSHRAFLCSHSEGCGIRRSCTGGLIFGQRSCGRIFPGHRRLHATWVPDGLVEHQLQQDPLGRRNLGKDRLREETV